MNRRGFLSAILAGAAAPAVVRAASLMRWKPSASGILTFDWTEEQFDYANIAIFGPKRATYNGIDYGVIALVDRYGNELRTDAPR